MHSPARHRLMLLILGGVFAFLYIPISVLVALSFNDGGLPTAWTRFSFKWYGELLRNADILQAGLNTLIALWFPVRWRQSLAACLPSESKPAAVAAGRWTR